MPRSGHTPERTCISCGRKIPKRELTRIVRTPLGCITADPTGKSAGRGSYLCGSPECWQRGICKGGLERSLRVSLSAQDRKILLDFCHSQVIKSGDDAHDDEGNRGG